jgi:ribosomal protein S18 acetylase RimI-like enzyme
MTDAEFADWITVSRGEYVRERVVAGEPEEVARRLSDEQHASLFPDGRPGAGHRLLVIEQDGDPIGMVWVGPHPQRPERSDSVWLYNIEIDQACRGRGVGRAALELLEQRLRADGRTELALNVFGHNSVARHLYSSAGYREVAVTMAKRLGG